MLRRCFGGDRLAHRAAEGASPLLLDAYDDQGTLSSLSNTQTMQKWGRVARRRRNQLGYLGKALCRRVEAHREPIMSVITSILWYTLVIVGLIVGILILALVIILVLLFKYFDSSPQTKGANPASDAGTDKASAAESEGRTSICSIGAGARTAVSV
jgi:hypothetical protein